MNATEWAAWVGACPGVGSLLWNVVWNLYTKRSAGPRLRVKASANLVQRPAPPGDPNFLRITVQNGGAAPTTITNLGFYTYLSRWARFRRRYPSPCAVLQMYQGPQLPYKLDPDGEFVALMEQDEKFDGWLSLGNLWCFMDHSFPRKSPALAKIFVGPK